MKQKSGVAYKVLTVVLLMILILPPVGARGVKEPVPHDEFLYIYFSRVLERFKYSLLYTYQDNPYGLKLANMTRDELLQIVKEAEVYQRRGIKVKVIQVLPPFYNFSTNLVTLDTLLLKYYSSNQSPVLAAGILDQIKILEGYLDQIDSITLRNGTKILKFNTKGVRKQLEIIRTMVARKAGNIGENAGNLNPHEQPEAPPRLAIYVSTTSPIVNQEVIIFGSAPHDGAVSLVIRGPKWKEVIKLSVKRYFFTTTYRFAQPGVYYIRAVQDNNATEWVRVRVRKIPTSFVVISPTSALINTTLNVVVVLVDVYSRPLEGKNVTVNGTLMRTDPSGAVRIPLFSRVEKTFVLRLNFKGDELHSGTSKVLKIKFTRIPTKITLIAPGSSVVGKPVEIRGELNVPLNVTIGIYVDNAYFKSVKALGGRFNLTLVPRESGTLQVYALFNGSSRYLPSRSNVVFISVIPGENKRNRYIGISLVLALLVILYMVHSKGLSGERSGEILPEITEGKGSAQSLSERGTSVPLRIPKDVRGAYRLLRKKLWEHMHVPLSLTPREVLHFLRWWWGYRDLSEVTEVHERVVYGGEGILGERLKGYLERIKRVITVLREV